MSRSVARWLLMLGVCWMGWGAATRPLPAQEIGFLEDFVLSKDRTAILKQLVPGTEDYYYFHALHYQTSEQLQPVEPLMDAWKKRFGETPRYRQILNRQMLLKYSDNPQATLEYLRQQLSLNFNHQREIPQAQRQLPQQLDPAQISTETLMRSALAQSGLEKISDAGLRLLAGQNLNPTQRRQLLSRLDRPDFPGLVDLIVEEFRERDAQPFGSLAVHQQLTLDQLDELARKQPRLREETNYVYLYLSKLVPSADVNWQIDRQQRRAYLDRLWAFVEPLSPNFNSLKANVLYQQLELNLTEEKFDRQRFLTYLKLPRNVFYINPVVLRNVSSQSHVVQLGADFSQQTRLPPVGNDDALVRRHLQHFLLDADDYREFEPFVRDTFLKEQFATTKILAGRGDVEKWASMLTPEAYKALLERVDLEFALSNPEFFNTTDPVKLELFTKNVETLIVKVFEINTQNYYRQHRREIDTDINLDGLVPNWETTHRYDTPPAQRVRREYAFPELPARGVFVIDFIAGGQSSRALVRRGRLELISQVSAAGHVMTVVDDQARQVKDATLWIQGQQYEPNESGQVLVPFSTQPGRVPAVITQGDFSCLQVFEHQPESYQFRAALILDRENLTRSNKARVLIRPSLQVAGSAQVPLSMIKNPRLVVSTVNLDGLAATQTLSGLKLADDEETISEFVVPPRLKSIQLQLTGEIQRLTNGQEEVVSASNAYEINLIDLSDQIQDVHLVPSAQGYLLEVLGKTGEVRPGQAIRVGLDVQGFNDTVYVDLQTDENGLIQLGPLDNVHRLTIQPTQGQQKTWALANQDQTYFRTMHVPEGRVIELPAPAGVNQADRSLISLYEMRGGRLVRDAFSAIGVVDGVVRIEGLPAGDYWLRLTAPVTPADGRDRHDIQLRVSAGTPVAGVLVSPVRHLEMGGYQQLQISTLAANEDTLRIELENPTELTRVHVLATRYQPAFSAYQSLAGVPGLEPWLRHPAVRNSAYQEGRRIGDEYEYILRRKYAQRFPGNMLERPSLLLNPWAVRETTNEAQDATEGSDFGQGGIGGDGAMARSASDDMARTGNQDFANLDYLGEGAVVMANLRPNDAGVLNIKLEQLKAAQHVRVVVVNGPDAIVRRINLPLHRLQPRDSRLASALNPEKHFSQSKQAQALVAGGKILVEDIISAKFQQYDDLQDVYTLLSALNENSQLAQFRFLLTWPQQPQEEKQRLYSENACHELNFFLLKKDREFFDKVVAPHLRNKRDKTFMDHFLLGEDLTGYTRPWNFARLNMMERILLAQRLEGRSADLVRHINDAYALSPIQRNQLDRLYDTAINGLGLMADQRLAETRSRFEMERKAGDLPELAKSETAVENMARGGGGGFGGGMAPGAAAPADALAAPAMELADKEAMLGEKLVQNGRQMKRGRELASGAVAKDRDTQLGLFFVQEADADAENMDFKVPDEGTVLLGGIRREAGMELQQLREQYKRLYQRVAATQEWIESNYYRLTPQQTTPELVPINQFWQDYANHPGGSFLSANFAQAHRTFTEAMFALAVLDLPFAAPENQMEFAGNSMTFTAGGPAIVLHQQVRDAVFDGGNTKILVSENFYQSNDRYRYENDVRYDKFVEGDFLAHTLYGGQVVITNPTSTPRAVELLIQIPAGSIACSGAQETRTIQLDLDAFSTKTFEYGFYFPTAGQFTHYPAHVSAEETVLAVADGRAFNVVDRQAELDRESWEFVSQNGTPDQVLDFLNQNNVLRLDLGKIAFRMKDPAFFKAAINVLRNRYVYHDTLWSYAIQHQDLAAIREYLSHDNAVTGQLGLSFESELVSLDPVQRDWYGHKEYWPLVNSRAHQLGPQRKILNPDFAEQYRQLLTVLSNRRQLTDDDRLVMTYYLLLQDRIESALEQFAGVSADRVASRLQYDYCDAYLDFYRRQPEQAAAKAAKWADYPVDRWRKRFQAILSQVDELKGGQVTSIDDRDATQKQTELAAQSPTIDLDVSQGVARLKYQNLKQVRVNFYEMDIELLFSRSPFAQDQLDGFSMIRPNQSQQVDLQPGEDGKGSQEIQLPPEMQNRNVLIEVVAGDQVRSQPYFANSLNVQLSENYGQVQVASEGDGSPIPAAYVKVYARLADGSVRFHKDGYTDLRGRFDYVSQSNRAIDDIAQFSILVLSDEQGAVIRQAGRPLE